MDLFLEIDDETDPECAAIEDVRFDVEEEEIEVPSVDSPPAELLCQSESEDIRLESTEEEMQPCVFSDPPGGTDFTNQQEQFVATDGQVLFTLAHNMRAGSAMVAINGLLQPKSEYSATANAILFNDGTGITAGDIVTIFYLTSA